MVDEAIALGGVDRMWQGLAPELAKLTSGFVWMLPAHRLPAIRDLMPADVPIVFEALHASEGLVDRLLTAFVKRTICRCELLKRVMEDWLANRKIREVCERFKITHVLYPALFVQRFPDVPLPIFAAVMDTNYHPSWRSACEANLKDWAKRAQSLVAISTFTLSEMRKLIGNQFVAQLRSIPIAVEGQSIADGAESRPTADVSSVYYPGSFNPHKGHAILLKAIRALHDEGVMFRTVMTGGGLNELTSDVVLSIRELEMARSEFTSAPKSFRECVEIKGLVSNEEVEVCYRNADFVVLPSTYEGFGLPLAEAIARGKRVLCSDIPAFREQVEIYGFEDAVTFVAPGEPEAWVTAIRIQMKNKFEFPYSPAALSLLFSRWTWRDVAAEYVEVLVGNEALRVH